RPRTRSRHTARLGLVARLPLAAVLDAARAQPARVIEALLQPVRAPLLRLAVRAPLGRALEGLAGRFDELLPVQVQPRTDRLGEGLAVGVVLDQDLGHGAAAAVLGEPLPSRGQVGGEAVIDDAGRGQLFGQLVVCARHFVVPFLRVQDTAPKPGDLLARGGQLLLVPTAGDEPHQTSPPARCAGISGHEQSITLCGSPPASGRAFVRNPPPRPPSCSARHAFCAANSCCGPMSFSCGNRSNCASVISSAASASASAVCQSSSWTPYRSQVGFSFRCPEPFTYRSHCLSMTCGSISGNGTGAYSARRSSTVGSPCRRRSWCRIVQSNDWLKATIGMPHAAAWNRWVAISSRAVFGSCPSAWTMASVTPWTSEASAGIGIFGSISHEKTRSGRSPPRTTIAAVTMRSSSGFGPVVSVSQPSRRELRYFTRHPRRPRGR